MAVKQKRGLIPHIHSTTDPRPSLSGRRKARWIVWRHKVVARNGVAKRLPNPHNAPPMDEYT